MMTDFAQHINWQAVLLVVPLLVGIVLFSFMLWSDFRRDRRKPKASDCIINLTSQHKK